MQVYKLNLGYSYYAVLVRPNEYLIIAPYGAEAAAKGFAIGTIIDDIDADEIEPAEYAIIKICSPAAPPPATVKISPKAAVKNTTKVIGRKGGESAPQASNTIPPVATITLQQANAAISQMRKIEAEIKETIAAERQNISECLKVLEAAELRHSKEVQVGDDIAKNMIMLVQKIAIMRHAQTNNSTKAKHLEREIDEAIIRMQLKLS